jgi:DNA ligase 1
MEIGQPFSPMLVKESGSSEKKFREIIKKHNGKTFAEVKSDGYRIQIHKQDSGIYLFTRNQNEMNPDLFPDLETQFKGLPNGIFDGELVGIEDGIRGYNAVKKRVRSTLNLDIVGDYPVKIVLFDVLNLKGNDVLTDPLQERRNILADCADSEYLSQQSIFSEELALQERFDEVTDSGLEGLVCKNPDSEYLIGRRTMDWIKLKKFLSLDLVILGVYEGQGKTSELPFAGLVVGTYNQDSGCYETITKVGLTNPSKIDLIYDNIEGSLSGVPFENVVFNENISKRMYLRKVPTQYVDPAKSVVVEIEAMDVTRSKNWHSCGLDEGFAYSLRIPKVREIRLDKTIGDCCETSDVAELYNH